MSLKRLGLLSPEFFEAFIDEIRTHLNLSNDAERLRTAIEHRAKADRIIEEMARKGIR